MIVRRFEHPTKHRFWEVYCDVSDVEIVSGKIGSNGRATRREFNSPMACAEFLASEMKKRIAEGFAEVVPEVVTNQQAPRATPPPVFLQRIIEAPDDDEPRMVFADWLQQQGDPLGELIAVQLEIAKLGPWALAPKALRDREQNLLDNFRSRWLPNVVGVDITFVRGFADSVRLDWPYDRDVLDELVEVAPLLRTIVFARDARRWQNDGPWDTASAGALSRFSGIWMSSFQPDDSALEKFLALDLPKLDRLGMRSMALRPSQLQQIADRDWRELDLHQNNLGTRGCSVLTERDRTALRALDIGSNDVMNGGLQILVLAKLHALERLSLRRSKLAPNGLRLLSELPALTSLDLSVNDIGGAFDFTLPALRELSLRETNLDDAGLCTLARSPLAQTLVALDVAYTSITELAPLRDFPALRSLNISRTPLAKSAKLVKAALPNARVVARATGVA